MNYFDESDARRNARRDFDRGRCDHEMYDRYSWDASKSAVKKQPANAAAMRLKWNGGERKKNTNVNSKRHTSNSNPNRQWTWSAETTNKMSETLVTATITVRVGSYRPEEIPKVAHIRRRDLDDWIKRHWKDIKNAVPSMYDDMTYDSTITVEESEDSAA